MREIKGGVPAPGRSGGMLVSQAQQLAGRVFSRILKKHGIVDLNPAQGRIVFALWKGDGIPQCELAARVKLDKSTMALMLERLERDGHVERRPDPADARRRIVFLTAKNRALHASYAAASREMIEIYCRGIGDEEMGAFESTLGKIIENLEAELG
jgi:DNA-binding MarR family transcriptional regulator